MAGKDIRAARRALDITQNELAEKLGLDPTNGKHTVSRWENDKRKPTIERASQLKEILGLTYEEIFD